MNILLKCNVARDRGRSCIGTLLQGAVILGILLLSPGLLRAELLLPAIFGDGMVLQRDANVPVWGKASPGEAVRVVFADQSHTTIADAMGAWRVVLEPMSANSTGAVLTVSSGGEEKRFDDVLVGEVWFAIGQSNMAWALRSIPAAYWPEPQLTRDPGLRTFNGTYIEDAMQPQAQGQGVWGSFRVDSSAVGYAFARELRRVLDCPIGVIRVAIWDVPIEAWMRMEALQQQPEFEPAVAAYRKIEAQLPEKLIEWNQRIEEWEAHHAWYLEVGKDLDTQATAEWHRALTAAADAGEPAPPRPKPSWTPRPKFPNGGNYTPTLCFNGMVAPYVSFAIRGMLFYQGESNVRNPELYEQLFPALIRDYRKIWGQGEFPFFFVQLANFEDKRAQWAPLRQSQLAALSEPATGMAVAIDLGLADNIHPPLKYDVGRRLALQAKRHVYGVDVVVDGPIPRKAHREGDGWRIVFDNAEGGLCNAPRSTDGGDTVRGVEVKTSPDSDTWLPVNARLDGASLLLMGEGLEALSAVRYAWANDPHSDIYNTAGLPASPFLLKIDP